MEEVPFYAHLKLVQTIITWVNKLIRLTLIKSMAQELVRLNLQKLEDPEITGVEYQQGE
ncbi:RRXRR domain-containing protein [Planktothrix pseudagardhii]|uniref:RRXRR domain-containing protein n=1 Tax=Planktothrix pseudagardhii TaxID=132604 RepID=UPI0009FB351F